MERINKIQLLLKKNKLDSVLVSSYDNILHLTQYAGFVLGERDAYIFITKNNSYLLTSPLYSEQTSTAVPHVKTLDWNQQTSFLQHVETIVTEEKITSVGFEAEDLTVAEYKHFKKVLPHMKAVNLRSLREIKTAEEIKLIQTACHVAQRAYQHILKQITRNN